MEPAKAFLLITGTTSVLTVSYISIRVYRRNKSGTRRRLTKQRVRADEDMMRLLHYLICIFFILIATSMMIIISQRTGYCKMEELMFQYLVITEMICVLMESVISLFMGCHKLLMLNVPKLKMLLIIFVSSLLFALPVFIDGLLIANEPPLLENLSIGNAALGEHNTAWQENQIPAFRSEQLYDEAEALDQKNITLDLVRLVKSHKTIKNNTFSVESTLDAREEDEAPTSTDATVTLFNLKFGNAFSEAEGRGIYGVNQCCLQWGSSSVIAVFIILLLLFLLTTASAIVKLIRLKRLERTGTVVALQDWFSLICRPFLSLSILLNWLVEVFHCQSPTSIYSSYLTLLMTSPIIYVITNDFNHKQDRKICVTSR